VAVVVQEMVNRQLERQQMNRERRMAEDEQFQKVCYPSIISIVSEYFE
jgi:hypothetical protein